MTLFSDTILLVNICKRLGIQWEIDPVDSNQGNDPISFPNQLNLIKVQIEADKISTDALLNSIIDILSGMNGKLDATAKTDDMPDWLEDIVVPIQTWIRDNVSGLIEGMFDVDTQDTGYQNLQFYFVNWIATKVILPMLDPLFIQMISRMFGPNMIKLIVETGNFFLGLLRGLS